MRRRPTISTEDAALFRAAIGPVRELTPMPTAPAAPPPRPRAAQRERDEEQALQSSRQAPFEPLDGLSLDAAQYRRDGVSERVWRKLRRGQFAVQDEFDLHGMDAAGAERALRTFMHEVAVRGHGCVRLIHGKGLHSETGVPVLRSLIERALRRRAEVLAYISAPPAMGGTGALLVLLSRRQAEARTGPSRP